MKYVHELVRLMAAHPLRERPVESLLPSPTLSSPAPPVPSLR
ncbi:hypothetical protein AB0L99_02620 [Streptomyces sp. NPDC051954]